MLKKIFPVLSVAVVAALLASCSNDNPTTPQTAPTITTQPQSANVDAGGSVTFTVVATGNPPITGYQWWKDDGSSINIVANATSASMTIDPVGTGDAAEYFVVISNSAGSTTSDRATLTVNSSAPVITTQPASQSAVVGGPVTFSVVATGIPAVSSYDWWTIVGGTFISLVATTTSPEYTIDPVNFSNAGDYRVVVRNVAGTTNSDIFTLTVMVPPSITTQPQAAEVREGDSVTFTVVATGSPQPTYQWQFNGVDISGATAADYSISSASLGDAGYYTVVVSNAAGDLTSDQAYLTVHVRAAPVLLMFPADGDTGVSVTPALWWNWSTDQGVTWYQFQVATAADFSTGIAVNDSVDASNMWTQLTTTLTAGMTYYWRVRAVIAVPGDWSDVWSFTTAP
jgi:hypothetical protein